MLSGLFTDFVNNFKNSDYLNQYRFANGEDLFYAAMACDGFTAIPRSDLGAFGDQGFDNVLIKRDATGNTIDVVINESKQIPNGSVQLNNRIQGTGNSTCSVCTQMTSQWIDDVLLRMSMTSNPTTVSFGAEIRSFGISNITRSVSGVDRATGE